MMHMHHNASTVDPLACACNALRMASRAVTRFYDEIMAETGLSLAQFAVLRTIARHEALPLMALAHHLVMDRTTLYRTLKPLEREGWVTLEGGGGRAKNVRLTEKGQQALLTSRDAWQEAQARLIGAFGVERWGGVDAALRDLVTITQGEMR